MSRFIFGSSAQALKSAARHRACKQSFICRLHSRICCISTWQHWDALFWSFFCPVVSMDIERMLCQFTRRVISCSTRPYNRKYLSFFCMGFFRVPHLCRSRNGYHHSCADPSGFFLVKSSLVRVLYPLWLWYTGPEAFCCRVILFRTSRNAFSARNPKERLVFFSWTGHRGVELFLVLVTAVEANPV